MRELAKLESIHSLIIVDLVCDGASLIEVSEKYGVSISSIRCWRKTVAWEEAERELVAEYRKEKLAKVSKLADKAIEAISRNLEAGFIEVINGKEVFLPNPASSQVAAAKEVLDRTYVGRDNGEVKGSSTVVLNLYVPPGARKEGAGETIEVEVRK